MAIAALLNANIATSPTETMVISFFISPPSKDVNIGRLYRSFRFRAPVGTFPPGLLVALSLQGKPPESRKVAVDRARRYGASVKRITS
jgi:hypothetical protein